MAHGRECSMGSVYSRKRKSCPLCKPNKTGWTPARSPKERAKLTAMAKDAAEEGIYLKQGGDSYLDGS